MQENIYENVGNKLQLFKVLPFEYTDGKAKGQRCLQLNNGVIEIILVLDRCMDVLFFSHKNFNIGFVSKNGIVGNTYANTDAFKFHSSFSGGFLYTCGLDNIGGDDEKLKVMHGKITATPAENVSYGTFERDGKTILFVQGEMKQTALFGENLKLLRRYEMEYGSNEFQLFDKIINEDYSDGEFMLLYHVNLGYPMLSEGAKIEANITQTENISPNFNQNDMLNINKPKIGREEEVYMHYLKEGKISLVNEKMNRKFEMNFNIDNLPYLMQWKSMKSGDYALGLEPSNSRFFENKKATILKRGEIKEFNLKFKVTEI